ncbi:MAG: tyrosine-type recombinase/integrase [Clostridia bacterium]|nr:tyrosine-type recombinase/integrase [Clostridia bacterium]
MRLPNGFGNVSKLSGKRRNPWRARKTTGWEIDPVTQRAKQLYITIGYYPSRQAALQALSEYNTNPYDIDASKVTFAEIYEKWTEKKYDDIATSNRNGYKAAFKLCEPLHKTRFADIKLTHLQYIVDNSGKSFPTKRKLKTLFNQLFDYAVMHEVISKDRHIVEYVDIGKEEQRSTMHYRFSPSEVDTLWRWSMNEYVQVILMLIYTGVRPGELFNARCSDVNLEEGYFSIEKGKTVNAARRVPIHDKLIPFFRHWMEKGNEYLITNSRGDKFKFDTSHWGYSKTYWIPVLQSIGIFTYKNEKGEIVEHLPHDTRHTFTSMWAEKRLDEAMRRKIQGHSCKGVGEMVYTHFEMAKLREEINKL